MSERELKGLHVLLVEDEALVAMMLENMLDDLGCTVVGPAGRLDEAQDLLDKEEIDAAILDINLAGEKVFPVADRLESNDVPFVFATGYGEAGLDQRHKAHKVLQKPYSLADLRQALLQEVMRAAGRASKH
jgi:CheY-like chemotaxis protein